jgi:hypothetical protein
MPLFRTIPQADYSTLDDRVWAHPGAIVDLGCHPWDWSKVFIGKKRVIGADPFATETPGTELYKGVIGAMHGTVMITCQGDSSNIIFPAPKSVSTPILTWKEFVEDYRIDQIAALKINIEGSEYALLHNMNDNDFAKIDQIAVSFHHFVWPAFAKTTEETLARLQRVGYTILAINEPWCWYLCLR